MNTRAIDDVRLPGGFADPLNVPTPSIATATVQPPATAFEPVPLLALDELAIDRRPLDPGGHQAGYRSGTSPGYRRRTRRSSAVVSPRPSSRCERSSAPSRNARRSWAGEVVSDAMARQNGWSRLDIKADPTAPGIDRIYLDNATGRYKVIEAKFFEGGDVNFSTGKLATTVDGLPEREPANAWLYKAPDGSLNDAIQRSVEANSITANHAANLRRALENGNLDKELVIVKNAYDGRTISDGFGSSADLGTGSGNPIHSTIVEIAKLLPLP